jgi:hypothetical protein
MAFIDEIRRNELKRNWGTGSGMLRGYYLCHKGSRYWFGGTFREAQANFDKVCREFLSSPWHYGVEFSHGPDVDRKPAWDNLDSSGLFA